MKKSLTVLIVVVLAGGAVLWYVHGADTATTAFKTAPVVRGDLVATIGATGTVEPEELVDVGAQVAGQVLSFGKDKDGKTIDYGSVVEANMVLAQIDNSVYASDVEDATAGVALAKANLLQMKAKLMQADLDWQRAQKLGPSDALAKSSYDAYQSAYEVAKANVAVGEAAIEQAQATLDKAKRNLDYCTITSPVKGVIIDRRVNIGQTVVSSLSAPSLFLIAKDLNRMQVWVSVSEADIGNIQPGQAVSFTVDAFPGQTFKGEVGKVRLNATMTQNVVTYTVEIITDNSSGKLIPYLTANAHFEVSRRSNVLQVPNAALRWSPQTAQIAPDALAAMQNTSGGRRNKSAGGQQGSGQASAEATAKHGVLWVQDGKYVRPVKVQVGISDELDTFSTEVEPQQGSELAEGTMVIIGEQQVVAAGATQSATNPFVPQLRPPRSQTPSATPTATPSR